MKVPLQSRWVDEVVTRVAIVLDQGKGEARLWLMIEGARQLLD